MFFTIKNEREAFDTVHYLINWLIQNKIQNILINKAVKIISY